MVLFITISSIYGTMKRKISDLTKQEIIITLDVLYTAASVLKGRDATKLFLRDLLTSSERIMLGRRIIIARLLIAGESYDVIQKQLRVGRATIFRVEKWLKDQFPGYERTIAEMEKEFFKREEKRLYATSSLYRLKKKYPLHYLLFPMPKVVLKRYPKRKK